MLEEASIWVLAGLFFVIAFMYSSVGLGGGSSYTALLTIFGLSHIVIPTVSLSLNLIVTTAGSFNFIQEKHARWGLIWPFLVTSIPMAYLGGMIHVSRAVFEWLLFISLIVVALRIYLWENVTIDVAFSDRFRKVLPYILGAVLGMLAGIVGIGGGIYLVPLIMIFGLGEARVAAATGAVFIWVNSIVGITARVQYQGINFADYIPLIVAVAAGGFIGSRLGATKYQPRTIQRIMGVVILIAIVLLGRRIATG